MSTDHFSTEAPWWAQHHHHHHHMMEPSMKSSSRKQNATTLWAANSQYHQQNAANTTATTFCTQHTAFSFNLNGHEDDEELDELQVTDEREKEEQDQEHIPKEALFEKPLTPSDVGKLNRLVIPKQHAEKYFPLSSSNDSVEKGLLLSFEDESGKSWRFRYSYWNSSQSYVLTKGWSRFVKEKRLDAGDIVMFERHRFDGDRFFIGWRRRNTPVNPVHDGVVAQPPIVAGGGGGGGGGGWNPMFYSGYPYPSQSHGPQLPYQPDCVHAGSVVQNQTAPSGHFKTLRLFGVNLECQTDQDQSEPSTPDGSSMSSHQGPTLHHQYQYDQNYSKSQPCDHHNHMEINFSRDVNQMGYHQR